MKESMLNTIEKLMNEFAIETFMSIGFKTGKPVVEIHFNQKHPNIIWEWNNELIKVINYV